MIKRECERKRKTQREQNNNETGRHTDGEKQNTQREVEGGIYIFISQASQCTLMNNYFTYSLKMRPWAEEMDQTVKYWSCKHEDLNLDFQNPCDKPGVLDPWNSLASQSVW